MNGLKKRMAIRAIATLIGASVLVAGLGAGPASAYTWQSGGPYCAGGFQVPKIGGGDGSYSLAFIGTATAHRVDRASCASGVQTIRVTYRAYRVVNGSWVQFYTTNSVNRVQPGYYWSAPGFAASGWYNTPMSVDMTIEWWSSTGVYLGWKYVDFNAQSDYVCLIGSCVTGYAPGLGGYLEI